MFREGGPFGEDQGVFDYATSIYASQPGNYYAQGGMLKRADGSYSQRGLWDNIRANKGSGKKPTKEMLAQERKISKQYETGGNMETASCPPGSYWNGNSCVKLPKGTKVITDPEEYAFRKAAYEDSLYLYNHYKDREPKKLGKARDTKGAWHSPFKTYTKTENLKGSEKKSYPSYAGESSAWNKYINKLNNDAFETGDFSLVDNIKYPENKPISIKSNIGEYNMKNVGIKTQTKLSNQEPRFKKPVQPVVFLDKNTVKRSLASKSDLPYPLLDSRTGQRSTTRPKVKSNPKQEISPIHQPVIKENLPIEKLELPKLPLLELTPINTPKQELQGEYEKDIIPEYVQPGYKVERPNFYWAHHNSSQLIPHPRLLRGQNQLVPSLPTKLYQKSTGYNPAIMEGYTDEEGNYIPGEIEQAQTEGRRINFQGASSKLDKTAQEEYNKAYDEYEAKKGYQNMIMESMNKGVNPFLTTSYRTGGQFPRPYSLPEDSFKQGGRNLHNSVYASSSAQYPAVYALGGTLGEDPIYTYPGRKNSQYKKDNEGNWLISNKSTGNKFVEIKDPTGSRSNELNKNAQLLNADNTIIKEKLNNLKKERDQLYAQNRGLGPSNMSDMLKVRSIVQEMGELESKYKDQLNNTPTLDKADAIGTIALTAGKYFAPRRVQKGLEMFLNAQDLQEYYNNPSDELNKAGVASDALSVLKSKKTKLSPFSYPGDLITVKQKFDQFNNATNQSYKNGGKINVVAGGEKHRVYIKESPTGVGEGVQGHVMVNHPTMDKGQWDTIDLTTKAGAKTVAEGIAATKKWHKENPNTYKNGGGMSSHFYASNVPDNNISNKDLTYPENSYVYAQGGNLNNVIMNKYPNVTNILRSGIHINPANKGKFTASANAAGMGVQEFASHVLANKDDYSSTQVKRANFAHNAAGWKHAMGGNLDMPNTMSFKYGGFNNPGFNALPKDVQAKIKARTFADGGTMPQLTEFNEGGRHEENPLGGIPQGVAGDGKLNLVEQGETKLNAANYIFSDTLKLDKGIASAFNLPKTDVGKTFAEISKKMNRPNSRRDNDTIEQNAKQRDLENLMQAQEAFKQVDLQKDMEMMERKHPEVMAALQGAMDQQAQGQPAPEEMQGAEAQGQPQMSPEEEQMMMAQQQGQMDPAMAEQMAMEQGVMPEEQMAGIPMSYGGTMFMRGGKMCYANGGHMYGKGGQVLRSIGAGAYGIGEGVLDAVSMGLTDDLTDQGYNALANLGDRSEQDLERDKMIRGFGNTAGAIGGAIVNPAATGSAISEGFEGLGSGLTGINNTNANFDRTVNSLAQVGSMAGSFVGGNPTDALGGLGKVQQNPFLQQVTGMKNGGHMYPTIYPRYKNNAGPMGQGLTNTQIYKYGGSFEMPRQQMYMPLDNVERMGGHLYEPGGPLDGINPTKLQQYVDLIKSGQAYLTSPEAAIAAGFDPDLVSEWTDPNTGDYKVPPAYRLNAENVNLIQNNLASALGGAGGSRVTMPNTNPYRNTPIERMPYLPIRSSSSTVPTSLAGRPSSNMLVTPNTVTPNTVVPVSNNNVDETNTENARININGTLYTKDEALKAAATGKIQLDPEEIDDYFGEAIGSYSTPEFDENNIKTQDEEDLENITYPGMSNENIITGGKGDYTDEELLTTKDEGYLTALKRAQMGIEDRNVNLQMKQTPLQALGLAAPIAYNLGMGLFSKPTQLKAEDYLNTSRINPYKVNVNPQLNETTLAYNAAMQSLKNNAPGGGAYLTNMGNLANMRSKNMKEILAGKENADAQLQMQADLQNAQLNAQNQSTKFAIADWNAKSKEAKRKYLEKAIEQTGTLAQNSQAMDAQERYMRLISPQYGKSFEYQNMFDQFMNYYKNKKDSNKEEE
jgi:hypothetical protein